MLYLQRCFVVTQLVPHETATFWVHHTTKHNVTSLHARPHTLGAWVFSYNLPQALLAELPGSFTCYSGNMGWGAGGTDTEVRVSTEIQSNSKQFSAISSLFIIMKQTSLCLNFRNSNATHSYLPSLCFSLCGRWWTLFIRCVGRTLRFSAAMRGEIQEINQSWNGDFLRSVCLDEHATHEVTSNGPA